LNTALPPEVAKDYSISWDPQQDLPLRENAQLVIEVVFTPHIPGRNGCTMTLSYGNHGLDTYERCLQINFDVTVSPALALLDLKVMDGNTSDVNNKVFMIDINNLSSSSLRVQSLFHCATTAPSDSVTSASEEIVSHGAIRTLLCPFRSFVPQLPEAGDRGKAPQACGLSTRLPPMLHQKGLRALCKMGELPFYGMSLQKATVLRSNVLSLKAAGHSQILFVDVRDTACIYMGDDVYFSHDIVDDIGLQHKVQAQMLSGDKTSNVDSFEKGSASSVSVEAASQVVVQTLKAAIPEDMLSVMHMPLQLYGGSAECIAFLDRLDSHVSKQNALIRATDIEDSSIPAMVFLCHRCSSRSILGMTAATLILLHTHGYPRIGKPPAPNFLHPDYAKGCFPAVQRLLSLLNAGPLRKLEVDYVVGSLCPFDIREHANKHRKIYEELPWCSGKQRQRPLARALAHIRWYAHLVVFNAYLHDDGISKGSFAKWIDSKPEVAYALKQGIETDVWVYRGALSEQLCLRWHSNTNATGTLPVHTAGLAPEQCLKMLPCPVQIEIHVDGVPQKDNTSTCRRYTFHQIEVLIRNHSESTICLTAQVELFRQDDEMQTDELLQQMVWSGPLHLPKRHLSPQDTVSQFYGCQCVEMGRFGFTLNARVCFEVGANDTKPMLIPLTLVHNFIVAS